MSDAPPDTPTRSRFEVHPVLDERDRRTRYRWRLVTRDGSTCLTSGTGFTAKADARRDALRVQAAASQAPVEDVTT